MNLQPGDILFEGEYKLLHRVGSGGFGTVWKASHIELGKLVALKIISGLIPPAEAHNLISEEGKKMANLNTVSHPGAAHIVYVNRIVRSRGVIPPLLELEWLDGGNLANYLRTRKALDYDSLRRLAWQMGAALDCAHRQGLTHGDVKPENILLYGDGPSFKLGDFGIARHAAQKFPSNAGTPAYMSPEQTHGGEIDTPSDIYALALVLMFAAGAFDPSSRNPARLPTLPKTTQRRLPTDINELIRTALFKTPAKRPSAADFYNLKPNDQPVEILKPQNRSANNHNLIETPEGIRIQHLETGVRFIPGPDGSQLWIPEQLPTSNNFLAFFQQQPHAEWNPLHVADSSHDGGYLEEWIDGVYPPRLKNKPIVSIPLKAARDFAAWLGGRLPTLTELQILNETGVLAKLCADSHSQNDSRQALFWTNENPDSNDHATLFLMLPESPFANLLQQCRRPSRFCFLHYFVLPVLPNTVANRISDLSAIHQYQHIDDVDQAVTVVRKE